MGRRNSGFSLPMILSIGIVAGLWTAGTAALLIPGMNGLRNERARDIVRDGAESAVDWAVDQLNTASPTVNLYVISGTSIITNVPSSVLGSNLSGTVTVVNGQPPTYTYFYDANYNPALNSGLFGDTGFLLVTANVTNKANISATLQVIMEPVYNLGSTTLPGGVTTPNAATTTSPPVAYYSKALFSQGAISASSGFTSNSYNSASSTNPTSFGNFGGVGTNTSLSLSSGASIKGDVVVTPTHTTSTVASLSSGASITGSGTTNPLIANGAASITSGAQITSSNGQTYLTGQSVAQTTLGPVPTAPTGLTSGNASVSAGATTTLSSSGTFGAAAVSSGGTLNITQGGSYVFSSLTINSGGTLSISPTITSPVNIYITGGTGNLTLGSGATMNNKTGLPSNLAIWDSESGTVGISSGSTVKAVIYAPNSTVAIGSGATLYGSITGNSFALSSGGTFHYDTALGSSSTLTWQPSSTSTSPTTSTTATSTTSSDTFTNYQAVSWTQL